MIIYEPSLKIYRNDFGKYPDKSTFGSQVRGKLSAMVGKHEDGMVWIRLRCSRSIVNREDNDKELYGHLSEWESIVKNDGVRNEDERLKQWINDFIINVDVAYQDNVPNKRNAGAFAKQFNIEKSITTLKNGLANQKVSYYK